MTMQGTKQQPGRAAPAAVPPRMQLGAVQRGRVERPPVVLLYGTEGVGKSSWAASAPEPIFLDLEGGTDRLDVARFPKPESWEDVLAAVAQLTTEQHEYRTLVVDTLDALEPLCWAYVCQQAKQPDIEAFGYGKGYVAALDQWRVFTAALERLIRQRSMSAILIAHSWIRPFKNPEGDDFDRYELKLHLKAGGFLKEWSEAVLFARYETFAHKDAKTKRVRGVSTGDRVIHTARTAAYDAKNRYFLPEVIPLVDWQSFVDAIAFGAPADAATLYAQALQMIAQVTDAALATTMRETVEAAKDNAAQLARIMNRIQGRLFVQAQATQENAQ